jgi:hypothetical protein
VCNNAAERKENAAKPEKQTPLTSDALFSEVSPSDAKFWRQIP